MKSDPIDKERFSKHAIYVLNAIENAGYQAWLVGGCVRDACMGRDFNDIDIATSAPWEETEDICRNHGMDVRRSGIKHGTVTVLVPANDECDMHGDSSACEMKPLQYASFEVTTYRIDSKTSSDCRHPDSVEFTDSIEKDLARRDFTINAMAWHPKRGLFDPFNGMHDIDNEIIRVVGDPLERFKEDALRILRGCRFSSQLGFKIDPDTFKAMSANKHLLLNISSERITNELDLLLMGDFVHDAIMECVDVLSICIPELMSMKGFEQHTKYHIFDVLEHTAWTVQNSKKSLKIRWAAFCHDMGKPSCSSFDETGVQHFYGHAVAGEKIARSLLNRLSIRTRLKDDICALVANHNDSVTPSRRCIKRAIARLGGRTDLMRDLLDLKTADMLAHAPKYSHNTKDIEDSIAVLDGILEEDDAFSISQLSIDGNDLISLGLEPGKDIGRILNVLLDEVIEGRLENDANALKSFVVKIINSRC